MKNIPQKVKKIYFMGICGTGMGSLAGLLKEMGYEVSGSDEGMYPPMSDQLQALGIPVYTPFHPDNLAKANPDLVIVGNVMMEKYPESQALLASDIAYTSMPQAMHHFLLKDKDVIVVSGTHGKTTTTSLMSHLLSSLGEDVGYFIGGVSKNAGKSFKVGKGRYFVIEGDEYDTAFFEKTPKFIHYNPKHVIMTSLEFDHADIYNNLDEIIAAFQKLATLIPEDGSLHYCHDYLAFENVVSLCKAATRDYSTQAQSKGWTLQNYKALPDGSSFEIHQNNTLLVEIKSPLTGRYNALNVMACFSVLERLGFDLQKASLALREFKGIKRRQDIRFQDEELLVVDDFAHHPTAVKQTIQAVKERFPNKHLIAIFEPRSNTSIRKIFQKEYAESFEFADEICLPEQIHSKKLNSSETLDIQRLASDIKASHKNITLHPTTASIIQHVIKKAPKPAVALIMSNGGFDNIHTKLITEWEKSKT